jgi:hypothetical protein
VIEYVDGRGVSEHERRLLRRSDPMLGQPLVIDPMPASSCADLLATIHRELGVPSAMAADLKSAGRHMLPVRAWDIAVVVVVDADRVAEAALRDLEALPERGDARIIATIDDPGERSGAFGSSDDLLRVVGPLFEHPDPGAARLRQASVRRVAAVAHQAGRVLESTCSLREIAFVAGAATVLHCPRSDHGTALRLFGLDHALRMHGHELHYTDEMFALARRAAWPHEWLLDAVRPPLSRQDELPMGDALATPMAADDETLGDFLSKQSPGSVAPYRTALATLLRWRTETGVPALRHDIDDLVPWAHDLLRDGETLGTVASRLGVARSYYRFLKSGKYVKGRAMTRGRSREPVEIHPDLIGYDLSDPYESLSADTQRALTAGRHPPVWSALGRRLAERSGWTDEEFWDAVESCRPPRDLWPLRQQARSALYAERERERDRRRLHGALFVLKYDIAVSALPPEVDAGSSIPVTEWVRSARRTGDWDAAVEQLRHWPAFVDLSWSRRF